MTTQVGGLPELSRDSVEMTKEVIMAEQELEAEDCRQLEGVEHTPVKPKSELAANLSGLSPSELVLVERSQDSVQVTKKRMERDHRRQPIHNTESDASCDTLEEWVSWHIYFCTADAAQSIWIIVDKSNMLSSASCGRLEFDVLSNSFLIPYQQQVFWVSENVLDAVICDQQYEWSKSTDLVE